MTTLLVLSCFFAFDNFWEIFSLVLALLGFALALGFTFRPKLRCCIYTKNNFIKVKLFNINSFRRIITDIKCEVTLSNKDDFSDLVETCELKKDWIVCLLKSKDINSGPNYVFYVTDPLVSNITKTHVRFRFLIPNFIGIKKAYEVIVPINDFLNQCITRTPEKPK
ncbi:MAG: hypothetical protein WCI71_07290 [Bacteroidota bacterium]